MAILGNNAVGATLIGTTANQKRASKFTLSTAATLTALWGYFRNSTGNADVTHIVIYSDSGGSPNARLAYTSAQLVSGSLFSATAIGETGLSVSLAAGDYWIGYTLQLGNGSVYYDSPGTYKGNTEASYTPPDDPFGTVTASGTDRLYSFWAVVTPVAGSLAAPFVGNTGTTVYTPTETGSGTATLTAPYVAAAGARYAPTVDYVRILAPYIAATGAVYTPLLRGNKIDVPFIAATGGAYAPTVGRTGLGVQPQGVNLSFADTTLEPVPTWTRLDT